MHHIGIPQETADAKPVRARPLLRGRVKISAYSEDGKEVILNIIEAGQIFGEIALLDGKKRTADASATRPTTLLDALEEHARSLEDF